jgi:hypothetical protein
VTPRDVDANFNLTYTKSCERQEPKNIIAAFVSFLDTDVDQKVDDAIESFSNALADWS